MKSGLGFGTLLEGAMQRLGRAHLVRTIAWAGCGVALSVLAVSSCGGSDDAPIAATCTGTGCGCAAGNACTCTAGTDCVANCGPASCSLSCLTGAKCNGSASGRVSTLARTARNAKATVATGVRSVATRRRNASSRQGRGPQERARTRPTAS
jgi:hypothetical protein